MTHVDDLDDPRLGDYVRLRDVQLRTKLESERVPWLMFRRATSMPASASSRTRSYVSVAGPRVQTILALRTRQA